MRQGPEYSHPPYISPARQLAVTGALAWTTSEHCVDVERLCCWGWPRNFRVVPYLSIEACWLGLCVQKLTIHKQPQAHFVRADPSSTNESLRLYPQGTVRGQWLPLCPVLRYPPCCEERLIRYVSGKSHPPHVPLPTSPNNLPGPLGLPLFVPVKVISQGSPPRTWTWEARWGPDVVVSSGVC